MYYSLVLLYTTCFAMTIRTSGTHKHKDKRSLSFSVLFHLQENILHNMPKNVYGKF